MMETTKLPAPPSDMSLATWILDLVPGSPCFCCGAPLRISLLGASHDLTPGRGDLPPLRCSRCGAGVSSHEAFGSADDAFGRRVPVLAAA